MVGPDDLRHLLAKLIVMYRGFAQGWVYAIGWLLSLPNELSAAGVTITFWRPDLNNGIWVAAFLVALALVQLFGVRGYGEGKLNTDTTILPKLTPGISRIHSLHHQNHSGHWFYHPRHHHRLRWSSRRFQRLYRRALFSRSWPISPWFPRFLFRIRHCCLLFQRYRAR